MANRQPYQNILDYWYSNEMRTRWFASTPALDDEIRSKFETLWQRASRGELDDWKQTAEGCLALAIVLDQLPLNMFRGMPVCFQTEQQAIEVSKYAIAKKFDQQIVVERLVFLYMPLMHSEKLEDQDMSVSLFAAAKLENNLRFAQHHRELIRKYGRFPHRNRILNRVSTPAESEYLASKEAFLG